MILDTSVVIAMLAREPGYEQLATKLHGEPVIGIGTPTLTECAVVLRHRTGTGATDLLDEFLNDWGIEEVSFTADHWRAAAVAYQRFGKGFHPAGLNFGDCMSYAAARVARRPLLFIGNDFSRTDIPAA